MKLAKENIYINLQGKSKEELTDLYYIIIKDVGFTYPKTIDEFIKLCKTSNERLFLSNYSYKWLSGFKTHNKQEVTIQELKEILQPMENKGFDLKGYSVEVDNEEQARRLQEMAFKQGFKWYSGSVLPKHLDEKFFHFNAFNYNAMLFSDFHFKDEYITKQIHFNDIFKTETIELQLEKAKAQVKMLKKVIEDSKIKVGDFIYYNNGIAKGVDKVVSINSSNYNILTQFRCYKESECKKITDQELINKLNELIK